MRAARRQVVVVGAGPVGLAISIDLALRGVEVTLLDRREGGGVQSKATTIWPRQLELLDRLGVAGAILEAGHRLSRITLNTSRRSFAMFDFGRIDTTSYPFGIGLAQPITERILESRAIEVGVQVLRQVEVVDVSQDVHGVSLRCLHKGHVVREMTADWLVAADGAHSHLRDRSGIRLMNSGGAIRFAITDVPIDASLNEADVAYYYGRDGALALVPFGASRFRIAVGVPPETRIAPGREDFVRLLRARAGVRTDLRDFAHSSVFDVRFGHAEHFRKRRVFLAGDAAHTLSPAGGQGMNTGLQDAANLAWKLAEVISGSAPDGLLDSYERERMHDYRESARRSAYLTQLGLVDRRVRRMSLRVLYSVGSRLPCVADRIAAGFGQLDTSYPTSARGSLSGRRFPTRFPLADDGSPTTYVVDPLRGGVVDWRGRFSRSVNPLQEDGSVLYGADAPLGVRRRLGVLPRFLTVRPDGHVERITTRRKRNNSCMHS